MKWIFSFVGCLVLAGALYAEPKDRYSLAYSTFIATGETPTAVQIATMTVRQGDMLAYIVCASTGTNSVVSVYDGVDTGGVLRAEVECHVAGNQYPFEVTFSSNATTPTVAISKTGTARVGLVFYVTHPIKEE